MIRHEHDYGAILLLDERFADAESSLSAWLRPAIQRPASFGSALSALAQVCVCEIAPSDITVALLRALCVPVLQREFLASSDGC